MPTVAVDWSGRATGAARAIWTAVVEDGELLALECGRDRDAAIDHLIGLATDELVVGFDFSFAFPAWFTRRLGAATVEDLWALAGRDGEGWLAACEPPFWGRPGMRRPAGDPQLRRTEAELDAVGGIRPKSTFQIGGAGAPGTGSIRGMPQLARLRAAGFAVWPFHGGGPPVAVEIYPRLLTGPVVKSSAVARRAYLAGRFPELDSAAAAVAASTEDAFDAAVSALVMDRHRSELLRLGGPRDQLEELEGRVWAPLTT